MKYNRNFMKTIRRSTAMLLAFLMIFNGSGIQTLAESAAYSGLEFVQKTSGAEYVVESEQKSLHEEESVVTLGEEDDTENADGDSETVLNEDASEKNEEADEGNMEEKDSDTEESEKEDSDQKEDAGSEDTAGKSSPSENEFTEEEEEMQEAFSLSGANLTGDGEPVPVEIRYLKENSAAPGTYKLWDTEIRSYNLGETIDVAPDYEWLETRHELYGYIKDETVKTITVTTESEVEFKLNCIRKTINYQTAAQEASGSGFPIVLLSGRSAQLPAYDGKRPGYTFVGYVDVADSTKKYQPGFEFTCGEDKNTEITLKAEWQPVKVTISYNVKENQGGSVSPASKEVEAAAESITGAEAVPADGWHVLGWSGKRNAGDVITIDPAWISADKKTLTPGHTAYDEDTGSYTFENSTYTVTMTENLINAGFRANAGTDTVTGVPSTISDIKYADKTAKIPEATPSRVGYDFKGWSLKEDGSKPWYQKNDPLYTFAKDYDEEKQDVVFYAVWEAKTYTITYKDRNGADFTGKHETGYPIAHAFGTETGLKGATRTGYTFKGWYTDSAATANPVTTLTAKGYTADITLYAQWELNQYKLTYTNMQDSTTVNPSYYTYTAATQLKDAERIGYDFNGWTGTDISVPAKKVAIATNSTGDRSFEAHWTAQTYAIDYKDKGGAAFSGHHAAGYPTTHTYDRKTELNVATKSGYSFDGWYKDEDCKTAAVTSIGGKEYTATVSVYAKWTAGTYTVRFHAEDGTAATKDQTITFDKQTNLEANSFKRNGYKFVGWTRDKESETADKDLYDKAPVKNLVGDKDETIDLYAIWAVADYTISYDLQGGALPYGKTNTEKYNLNTATFKLVNPERANYDFDGWTLNGGTEKYMEFEIPQGAFKDYRNLSFTANWKATAYTLTYNLAEGKMEEGKENPDTYTVLSPSFVLNNPVRTGFDFDGWTSTAHAGKLQEVTIKQGSSGDWTYTANWQIKQVKIIFDMKGHGEQISPIVDYYASDLTKPSTPSAVGYEFVDWYINSECQGKPFDWKQLMPANDTILYAKWTKGNFTISFNMNGHGTQITPIKAEYEEDITKQIPASPSEFGCQFEGWYRDAAFEQPYTFPETMPGENIELYAKWAVGRYTFTYDLMYGGKTETVYRDLNDGITLKDAVRIGYQFEGWYKERELENKFTAADAAALAKTQNQPTVYAKWTEKSYTFTYDLKGGFWTEASTSDVVYRSFSEGITLRPASSVTNKGYSFGGWYPDQSFAANYTQAQADRLAGTTATPTVYAKWSRNYRTITYRSEEGGTAHVTGSPADDYELVAQYQKNTAYTVKGGTVEVAPGYTFLGWFKDGVKVSDNTILTPQEILKGSDMVEEGTYTAKFSMNHYGVVFQWNEATSSTIDPALIDNPNKPEKPEFSWSDIAYSQLFQLPYGNKVTKEGYRLLGWYVDGNFRTPGQLVSELTAKSGGVVTVIPCWTPANVVISYISTGFGETSRELDRVTAASASSVEDVVASVSDTSGYRFKVWKIKDSEGNWATLSEAKTLTGDQIRTVAFSSTASCYVNTDIYCDFEEITYTLKLYGLTKTSEADYPYSDPDPYVIENIKYNQEITLPTWDELLNMGYTQFDIRGSVFKCWNEYDEARKVIRTFANAQNVSKLTTTDGGTVKLVSDSDPKIAQLEYVIADYGRGSLSKVKGSSTEVSGKQYIAWDQDAYAEPEDVYDVLAVPNEASKFSYLQIAGEDGKYRSLKSTDPVTVTYDSKTRTGTIKPKKESYGGDEAYISYTVNAVFDRRDVKVNFYNYDADLSTTPSALASVNSSYDISGTYAPRISSFSPKSPGANWKFIGWSYEPNQNNNADALVLADGEDLYIVNRVYQDEVDLFAVWTDLSDPVLIRYHQNDDRWGNITRKFAIVERSGAASELLTTKQSVASLIQTKEQAEVKGGYYWDAWYPNKGVSGEPATPLTKTPQRDSSGYLYPQETDISPACDILHFRANWNHINIPTYYAPQDVTVHYGGHKPTDAPDSGDGETYTISTTTRGGSDPIRVNNDGISRNAWSNVFGTSANPPVSTADSYVFEGWYTDPEYTTLWVFNDDTPKRGNTTYVRTTNHNIYAKWSEPQRVVISYAAGEGGTVYVRDADNTPTAQTYESVIVSVDVASGSVVIPDTGYRFVKWEGKEINPVAEITIPESWVKGLLFNPGWPNGKNCFTEAAYTARFAPNNYQIRFYDEIGNLIADELIDVPEGGTATSSNYYKTLTYNTNLTLPTGSRMTKDGCTFVGWQVMDIDGQIPEVKTQYAKGMNVINLSAADNGYVNLKAVWEDNIVYLSYEQGGGGVVHVTGTKPTDEVKTEEIYAPSGKYVTPAASQSETYIRGVTAVANTGYKFDRWEGVAHTDDKDEHGHEIDMTGVTSNVLLPGKTGPWDPEKKLPKTIYERATYKAFFSADTYKVTFHNGAKGTAQDTDTYTQDTVFVWDGDAKNLMELSAIQQASPSSTAFLREGYDFEGWRRSDSVTYPLPITDGASVVNIEDLDKDGVGTGRTDLYAIWKVREYEIRFNSNGGTPVSTIRKDYGSSVSTPSDPTRTGYTFLGWDGIIPKTMPAHNTALNAQWQENTYKFTYHTNDGAWVEHDPEYTDVEDRPYSEALTLRGFSDITRDGYDFIGWFTDPAFSIGSEYDQNKATALAGTEKEVDVYAKWSPKNDIRYSILHVRQGLDGTFDESSATLAETQVKDDTGRYLMGETDAKTQAAKYAKSYTGFIRATVTDAEITANGKAVAKICYTRNRHTVKYDVKGHGTTPSSVERYYQEDITDLEVTLSEDGYIFEGWYSSDPDKSSKKYIFGTMPNSDLTVYAKWTPVEYTVAYAGNGNDGGSMKQQVFKFNAAQELAANGFHKNGYSFLGWDTDAAGKTVVYQDEEEVINLANVHGAVATLTAVWKANSYSVVFNGNNSTSGTMENQSMVYDGAPVELTKNVYVRYGYHYLGWDTSPVGKDVVYTDSEAVKNLTPEPDGKFNLYAVWAANGYTVRFDGNGSTSGSMEDQAFNYGEKEKSLKPNEFERTGYIYLGWSTSSTAVLPTYADKQPVNNLAGGNNDVVTMYAVWAPGNDISYTVEYWLQKVGAGTNTASDYVRQDSDTLKLTGTADDTVTAPVKDYTGFVSPAEVSIKIAPNGKTVHCYYYNRAYYQYQLSTCTGVDVSASTQTKSAQFGETITLKASHPGYLFKGWVSSPSDAIGEQEKKLDSTSFTMPAKNVDVTPSAEIINYQIEYLGIENVTSNPNPATYTYEQSVVFADASKAGYDFKGWYEDAAFTKASSGIPKNSIGKKTVYAKWEAHVLTVTFDKTDGESLDWYSKEVTFDKIYNEGTPSGFPGGKLTGYHLNGWQPEPASGSEVTTESTVKRDENHILYADWEPNKYYVKFNANKGSGNMADQEFTYNDSPQELSDNKFTRTGYAFLGWATSSEAAAPAYSNKQAVRNLRTDNGTTTFYAVWEPITFDLCYNTNYPSGVSSEYQQMTSDKVEHTYDVSFKVATVTNVPAATTSDWTFKAGSFEKAKYTMKGWTLSRTPGAADRRYQAGDEGCQIGTEHKTYTLYAEWIMTERTITYHYQDGRADKVEKWTFSEPGTSVKTLENPKRTGYLFRGWYKETTCANEMTQAVIDGWSRSPYYTAANTDLYAKWEPIKYKVQYNPNTPSERCSAVIENPCCDLVTWTYDDTTKTIVADNGMKLLGYQFNGWYTKKTGGEKIGTWSEVVKKNLSTANNAKVTLHARWEPLKNRIRVCYWLQDLNASTYSYGGEKEYNDVLTDQIIEPKPKEFEGFTKPAAQKVQVLADGSQVVNYYYTRNSYLYTVAGTDGTDISAASPSSGTTSLQYGTAISLNATHTDPGFTWDMWVSSVPGKQANVATESGYTITMPATDLTMTASASIVNYPIHYWNRLNQQAAKKFEEREKRDGGTYPDSYTIRTKTTQISNPLPAAQPGYDFRGWNTDGSLTTTPSKAYKIEKGTTGEINLYAMYDLLQLGVSVDYTPGYSERGGETITYEDLEYDVEHLPMILVPTASEATHRFVKWRRTLDSLVTYLPAADFELTVDDDDAKYKAIWEFEATFVPNGGTWTGGSTDSLSVWRPEESGLTLKTGADIRKTGYHLAGSTGWYKNASLTEEMTAAEAQALKDTYVTPTVYAKWEANNYTVQFEKTSGTGSMETQSFVYDADEKPLTANGFTKSGYTFSGWATSSEAGAAVVYADEANVRNLTGEENGVVRLYAVWTPNEYRIGYLANTPSSASTVVTGMDTEEHKWTVDKEETLATAPSLTGYTFDGWFDQASGGRLLGMGQGKKAAEVNLASETDAKAWVYAHWHANTYTVKYNGNKATGGSTAQQTMTFDQPENLSANGFTRTGYTYQGWSTASDATAVKYADKQEVVNLSPVQGAEVTMYAVWNANTYTVEFNGNGNTGGTTPSDMEFTYDVAQNLNKNSFAKTGYHFTGWATSPDAAAAGFTDGQSVKNLASGQNDKVTLYAVWKANGYTVTFNGNGNTDSKAPYEQNHTYDQSRALTANKFAKTGYRFAGWAVSSATDAPAVFTESEVVKNLTAEKDGNVDLFALWEANTYKVTYDGNKPGTASTTVTGMDTKQYTWTYDQPASLTDAPKLEGYTFTGWYDGKTGDGLLGMGGGTKAKEKNLATGAGSDASAVVYAHWQANTYKVNFNGNTADGGTTPSEMTYTFDQYQALNYNTFTKTGYHFTGWATDSSATQSVYSEHQSVRNLASGQDDEVTLYAVWAANGYTVVFDGNGNTGGNTAAQAHVYDEARNLTANGFVKTGYTFIGWATASNADVLYADKASVKNLTAEENGIFTLYAKWRANTYKIRYESNTPAGASTTVTGLDPNEYTWTVDQPASLSDAPKLEGYTFTGWYDAAGSGERIGDALGTKAKEKNLATEQDATASVYAGWKANTYTVRFDGSTGTDGTPVGPMAFTFDEEQALSSNTFAKKGYTFQGWNTASQSTAVLYTDGQTVKNLTSEPNGTVTLYAVWKANTYRVTYDGNKPGTASTTVTDLDPNEYVWTYDQPASLTDAPKLEGYTFTGWYDKASGGDKLGMGGDTKAKDKNLTDVASASVAVYAHWTPNNYTVKFNGNGQTGGTTPSDMSFVFDVKQNLSANTFVRSGYAFEGWATSSNATASDYADKEPVGNLTSEPDGVVTLYAVWGANTYKLHFNAASDSTVDYDEKTVTYGLPYGDGTPEGLPVAYKTGYTHLGWFTAWDGGEERKAEDIVTVAQNQELYPHWTPNRYRVRFAGNGATGGTMEDQNMIYDQAATLSDNRYYRKGYTYIGWASTGDAATPDHANREIVLNMTATPDGAVVLYAVWKINSYNVSFDLNGGAGNAPEDQMVVYGDKVRKPADPARPGYLFKGWKYNDRIWDFDSNVVEQGMKLVAQWTSSYKGGDPIGGPGENPVYVYPAPIGNPKTTVGDWELPDPKNRVWKLKAGNGQYVKGGWAYVKNPYTNNGHLYEWFFFDGNGIMQYGWIRVPEPYAWYYANAFSDTNLGMMVRGWHDDPQDGFRYYLDPVDGKMHTGWTKIDGREYYFETVGLPEELSWYRDLIDPNVGLKMWQYRYIGGKPLGSMYRNEFTPDGHFVDENGVKVF